MELNLEAAMKAADDATLRALAENMNLASSNDVLDTLHWLREHAALVGLAAAIEWYVQCAASRDNDPFTKRLDWKAGIAASRKGGQ